MNTISYPQTTSAPKSDILHADIWKHVLSKLRFKYGEATYNSWFKNLCLVEADTQCLTVSVSTRFVREWVENHYAEDIRRFWHEDTDTVPHVTITIAAPQNTATPGDITEQHAQALSQRVSENISTPNVTGEPRANTSPSVTSRSQSSATPHSTKQQRSPIISDRILPNSDSNELRSTLDPRATFDNFVVGPTNELAYAAARSIADAENIIPGSNPLFLYGGVGLGKTHLMHAIAHHIRAHNPQRKVLYLSAEKFTYQFIRSLQNKDVVAFKEFFRSTDVLMIDDIQFICGKNSTQEEFFHTFNALIDNNKQLILSGDRSPSDLDGMEERIRSRLGWGLVADINATTYELRFGILQSKVAIIAAEYPDINIPKDVIDFLAGKVKSNVRELEGALNKVVAHARLTKRPTSLESTQILLQDLLRSSERSLTIDDIKQVVAEHCCIRVSDMQSARRSRNIARPRQIAMYLAKNLTTHSYPEIGKKFGGKDHTTVMHAIKRIEHLCQTDQEVQKDVELLTRMLRT